MTPFSRKLVSLRWAKGLRQKELARRLDVDAGYLSRLERSKNQPPSDAWIEKLGVVLELSPQESEELVAAARVTRQVGAFGASLSSDQIALACLFRERVCMLTNEEVAIVTAVLQLPIARTRLRETTM